MSEMRDDDIRADAKMRDEKEMPDDDMHVESQAEDMHDDVTTDPDVRKEEEKDMPEERPMAEHRVMEREGMTTNPEVMGRKEPVPVEAPKPEVHQMDMWAGMDDFGKRFDQLQSEFIDEPKEAVQKAERLVEEMLDHVNKTIRDRMHTMHRETGSEANTDTEELRQAMRAYKEVVHTLGHREAA